MTWERLSIASEALRGNPLGDPHERPLHVWAPSDRSRTYPTVYVLHAHMRSGPSWFNVEPFERSYPEEIEALSPEAVVVLVDGWTSVGGSQWIDSEGVGRYASYLRDEVVRFVEERFPCNGLRALQGKSSGGYGALVHALERPDLFAACAAHAPTALFDVTVARDFPAVVRELRERGVGLRRALSEVGALGSPGDALLVEVGALAYAFSDGALPFDLETAELERDVWGRWLARDPLRLVARHGEALQQLRGIWLDAGRRDEYFLDLGAVALRRALTAAGFPETQLHFELVEGGHRGMSGRYPLSLRFLVDAFSISRSPGSPNPSLR